MPQADALLNHPDSVYFKFIKTKDQLLAKYFEGFYILQKTAADDDLQYTVFTSNHVILTIYRFADCRIDTDSITISEDQTQPFLSLLTISMDTPLCCSYKGAVREISFCFEPLGFNQFLSQELRMYFQKGCFSFSPFTDFEDAMQSILTEKDEEMMQDRIEAYWLSKLQVRDFGVLEKIVTRIREDHSVDIQQLAAETGVSRQHIVRLFDAHLCKSPSVFRKIDRFRKTLQNRVAVLKAQDNLTALTYESLFYDQSHLIRDFKSLTGMSPRKFFEGNRAFENGHINWFFPA